MTLQVSTKFKEMLLGPYGFADIFNGGRILIYSGSQPASADHAVTGTYLGQITTNGNAWAAGGSAGGLQFELVGEWVSKSTAATWKLKADAAGTAGWFRLVGPALDDNALSYNFPRIDGSVGDFSGVELVLENPTLAVGDIREVQQFLYTIPPFVGI